MLHNIILYIPVSEKKCQHFEFLQIFNAYMLNL